MSAREIRVNITFSFDDERVSETELKERLDDLLIEHFADCGDWNARWVESAADSPSLGAASPTEASGTD